MSNSIKEVRMTSNKNIYKESYIIYKDVLKQNQGN